MSECSACRMNDFISSDMICLKCHREALAEKDKVIDKKDHRIHEAEKTIARQSITILQLEKSLQGRLPFEGV